MVVVDWVAFRIEPPSAEIADSAGGRDCLHVALGDQVILQGIVPGRPVRLMVGGQGTEDDVCLFFERRQQLPDEGEIAHYLHVILVYDGGNPHPRVMTAEL